MQQVVVGQPIITGGLHLNKIQSYAIKCEKEIVAVYKIGINF